jgi:hypothetical protein
VADPTLIVPVQVDALAVNKTLMGRDGFRLWPFAYSALRQYSSPQPPATARNVDLSGPGVYLHWVLPQGLRHGVQDATTGEIVHPLVPNRWLVARFSSSPSLTTKAWVVESDCPYGDKAKALPFSVAQASDYLPAPETVARWRASSDPYRSGATLPAAGDPEPVVNIGVPFPFASWTERDPTSTFLTALAPANPLFPIYVPHNSSVFSLYDDMTEADGTTAAGNGPFSYMVVGWYSNPPDDVMTGWQGASDEDKAYTALLERLGWTVADTAATKATRSLYEGMALSVGWDADPSAPPIGAANDPLAAIKNPTTTAPPALSVAIGNTSIDAFTALMAAKPNGITAQGERLLRAFQYDLLPLLDQPNGDALLDRRTRQAWFGSAPSGYSWTIVSAENQDGGPVALTPDEAAWIAQLNSNQAKLDEALGILYHLQWQLNALWWKTRRWPGDAVFGPPPGVDSLDELTNQLDPTFKDAQGNPSLAALLLAQLELVEGLADPAKVPQPVAAGAPTPAAAFRAGVEAFAAAKNLDETKKVLKPVEAPRYWSSNDPVLVVWGVQPPTESAPNQTVPVRQASDLVAGFTVGTTDVTVAGVGSAAPALPSSSALPADVGQVVSEWFLLDPANAPLIAAATGLAEPDVAATMSAHPKPAYRSPLPAEGLAAWAQPWEPMLLEWVVEYTPIAGPDGSSQWEFDGEEYQYVPADSAPVAQSQEVNGISLLSPHAQFVLGARLSDFLSKYGPDADLEAVYEQVFGSSTQLPFVTQALTGFNEQLAVRDLRPFRRPASADVIPGSHSVADLAGFPGAGTAPGSLSERYRGRVRSVPYIDAGVSPPFSSVRAGQCSLKYLAVYDKFGRVLPIVDDDAKEGGLWDSESFPAVIDEGLALPDPSLKLDSRLLSVAQLAPRILQPARLEFDLLDAASPASVLGQDPDANPVCAWLLPNHLDASILLYAPNGAALGEYCLVETATGEKTGHWDPPPHSPIATLAELAAAAPYLGQMLQADAIGQPAAFAALLDVIDTTLWTTDPLGSRPDQSLSALIGRPLALVRAGLRLSLDGPAALDGSWASTFDPPAPDSLTWSFSVRLGDLATRDDGLVGYFAADDYEHFNSVAAPQETTPQGYVQPIGRPLSSGKPNYLTLVPNAVARSTVTMLVDPRGSVHATSGVVPVTSASLPARAVDSALDSLEVTFRLAPVLTTVQATPTTDGQTPASPTSVALPLPSERGGQWSFWDQEPGWTSYGLVKAGSEAKLAGATPTLRDGLLQLVIDLDKPT